MKAMLKNKTVNMRLNKTFFKTFLHCTSMTVNVVKSGKIGIEAEKATEERRQSQSRNSGGSND